VEDSVEEDNDFPPGKGTLTPDVEFVSEGAAVRTLDGVTRSRRAAKIRRTKGSPKLLLGLCPEDDYNRLSIWTNEEIRKHTIRWLDEIEAIRKKNVNINRGLSGKIRSRIRFLKSVVNILVERAEDQGSAVYNRAKSEEMEKQLRAMERTVAGLKEDFQESEKRNKNLRERVRNFEERIGLMSVSFEEEKDGRGGSDPGRMPREKNQKSVKAKEDPIQVPGRTYGHIKII